MPEERKAQQVIGHVPRWITSPKTVTHSGGTQGVKATTNTLIGHNVLTINDNY